MFLDLYIRRREFFLESSTESRKVVVVGKERLFDGVKKGTVFFVIFIVDSVDVASVVRLLLVELVLAFSGLCDKVISFEIVERRSLKL